MKKTAWTMTEMVIAIVVLAMLSGICASLFKPNIQKARMFIYSAMRDINGANEGILEKYGTLNQQDLSEDSTDDYYCVHVADLLNLSTAANCAKNAAADAVNIRYSNGVTIQGLASAWQNPYPDSPFQFKNFVVDINGSSGPNKVWVDRFPLRVIGGPGYATEGSVVVVNCGSEVVYNDVQATPDDVAVASTANNPYCKDGWSASGTANTTDFTNDNQIISYDVLRASTESDEEVKAITLMSGVSQKLADCSAFGGTEGLNSAGVCNTASMRLLKECANQSTCLKCLTNSCPAGSSNASGCKTIAATSNPENLYCFIKLHKPSIGAHFIFQAILGNMDEEFN